MIRSCDGKRWALVLQLRCTAVSLVVTHRGVDPDPGQIMDLLLDMPPGVLSFAFAILDVLLETLRCGVSLAELSEDHEAFAALADVIH